MMPFWSMAFFSPAECHLHHLPRQLRRARCSLLTVPTKAHTDEFAMNFVPFRALLLTNFRNFRTNFRECRIMQANFRESPEYELRLIGFLRSSFSVLSV